MKRLALIYSLLTLFSNYASAQQYYVIFFAYPKDYIVDGEPSRAGHAFVSFIKKDYSTGQTILEGKWGFHPMKQSFKALFKEEGVIHTERGTPSESDFVVEIKDVKVYERYKQLKQIWDSKNYSAIAGQTCVDFARDVAYRIPGVVIPPSLGSTDKWQWPKDFLIALKNLNQKLDTEGRKSLSEITTPLATTQLIPYRQGRKWGYCDASKKIIISCRFDRVSLFSEGLAAVTINEKMGYIDKTGKLVIPCKFGEAGPFNKKGSAVVDFNSTTKGLARIDRSGQVIEDKYCKWMPNVLDPQFFCDLAVVTKEGEMGAKKYGFIDEAGKLVIPFSFAKADGFSEDVCAVFDGNDKWAWIDKKGNLLTPYESFLTGYGRHFHEGLSVISELDSKSLRSIRSGYMDHSFKKTYITDRYTVLHVYGEELFLAEKNQRIGFIDKDGKVSIPFIFTPQDYGDGIYYGSAFKNGLAIVSKNNKLALINKRGVPITSFMYEDINYVKELNLFRLSWQSPRTAPYLENGYMSAQGVKYWQE